MKYLITGGLGFIGSNLVDALIERGDDVIILDNVSTGRLENLNPKATLIKANIQDEWTLFDNDKFDTIFHLAALPRIQPSIIDPFPSNDTNITGTLRLLMYAVKTNTPIVYSSSSSIYGDQSEFPITEGAKKRPKSPYALQKYIGEQYIEVFRKLHNIRATSLRYFNVYGPRQLTEGAYSTVLGIFLKQKKEGNPFTVVGDGEQRRDFTFVGDVVNANILASEKMPGGSYNIGTGWNWSVNEIADLIDKDHPRVFLPARPGECRETLASAQKSRDYLGWKSEVQLDEWINSVKYEN